MSLICWDDGKAASPRQSLCLPSNLPPGGAVAAPFKKNEKPIPGCPFIDKIGLLAQIALVTGYSFFGQLEPSGLFQEPPDKSKFPAPHPSPNRFST